MATRKKSEPDSVFRFQLDDKPYEIDAETLTFGEIEDLELYFDRSYDEIDLESSRGTMFLAYLARRRVEPEFTLDDMRALPVISLKEARKSTRPTSEGADSGTPS